MDEVCRVVVFFLIIHMIFARQKYEVKFWQKMIHVGLNEMVFFSYNLCFYMKIHIYIMSFYCVIVEKSLLCSPLCDYLMLTWRSVP